jgi:hypothetical protein
MEIFKLTLDVKKSSFLFKADVDEFGKIAAAMGDKKKNNFFVSSYQNHIKI